MSNRIDRHSLFTLVTLLISQRSTCQRLKVGAVIVRDGRIISIGYNGPAIGVKECFDCQGAECTKSIHAETNAISYAAREGSSVFGADMYCNYAPCINCAKMISAAGIKRLIYLRDYRKREGLDFLKQCEIQTLLFSRLGYETKLRDALEILRENLEEQLFPGQKGDQ